MTREEAITKYIVPSIEKTWNDKRCKEILEALKQEPCEDCISRQAVEDAIYDYSRSCDVNFGQIMEYIDKIPSVTPAEKIGRWINGDDKCPCCGKSKFEGLDADIWADWQSKYCPNCGAKMEVEE